ncbi:hypothetical protein chiPu_0000723 [Chiloscyllium punctatum]|uniref:Uncharacterized protein n=1 Tax=Chiloscyllium punctatum TaxID=137246 RepID=A0A401RW01_CHIPU|nr:hypothetical protein [Chiloscyllium punctatum]
MLVHALHLMLMQYYDIIFLLNSHFLVTHGGETQGKDSPNWDVITHDTQKAAFLQDFSWVNRSLARFVHRIASILLNFS